MVKIAVTGGSGFIGTSLLGRLLDGSHHVTNLDLKTSRRYPACTINVDIRNRDKLAAALDGEVVYHLAAVHRDDVYPLNIYHETNVEGTRNVCIAMERRGVERVVFTSSVAVYGFAPPNTGEDGAINPFNEYGRTKYSGELVLREWQARYPERRSLTIVRPTVVFGEGNRGNVHNLLRQINDGPFLMVGSGRNKKSMAYVGNIARFLELLRGQPPGVHVVNYVDKPDLEMRELVSLVRRRLKGRASVGLHIPTFLGYGIAHGLDGLSRLTKRNFPVSAIRIRKFVSTTQFSSAAHEMPGFKAPYALSDAIVRTVDYEFLNPPANPEEFFTE